MKKVPCPGGCGGMKSENAALCADCRRRANAVGVSVVTHVHEASPATARPRTPQQNTVYHGRLRELAILQHGGPFDDKADLWKAERRLKKWALEQAERMFRRELESSTELSEIEMERLNEWLGDRIDELNAHAPA